MIDSRQVRDRETEEEFIVDINFTISKIRTFSPSSFSRERGIRESK